jgi:hypothetical protein
MHYVYFKMGYMSPLFVCIRSRPVAQRPKGALVVIRRKIIMINIHILGGIRTRDLSFRSAQNSARFKQNVQ